MSPQQEATASSPPPPPRRIDGDRRRCNSESQLAIANRTRTGRLRKTVSFGNVGVREFNRTVGDHPACTSGPPMTIDWMFVEQRPVTVDNYEGQQHGRRHGLFAVPSEIRKEILQHGFQVPEEEILAAEKLATKAAKQREKTRKQQEFSLRTRRMLKNTSRWMPSFRTPTYTE